MVHTTNAVEAWRQRGHLFFWRYTVNERNYPGWHFMLDVAGRDSVSALITALSQSGSPLARTIVVSPLTEKVVAIPNNRGGLASCVSPGKIRITFASEAADAWSIEGNESAVEWRFGSHFAPALADAFSNPEKYFDSTIGENPRVWSWGLLPNTSLERTRDR